MYKFIFLIATALVLASMANGQCTTALTCANNNVFNQNTCKCDCFPSYSGTLCEILNCTRLDPTSCSAFGSSNCNVGLVKGKQLYFFIITSMLPDRKYKYLNYNLKKSNYISFKACQMSVSK